MAILDQEWKKRVFFFLGTSRCYSPVKKRPQLSAIEKTIAGEIHMGLDPLQRNSVRACVRATLFVRARKGG